MDDELTDLHRKAGGQVGDGHPKVDLVAKITFGGLTGVVDSLGGIELCYDQDVDDVLSDLHWKAGCHVVDGHTALAFSRMR